jgi:hypothetical protein
VIRASSILDRSAIHCISASVSRVIPRTHATSTTVSVTTTLPYSSTQRGRHPPAAVPTQ